MKAVKKILSIFLCIILFASVVFSCIATPLKFTLYNVPFYKKQILTDEFVAELKASITDIIYKQLLLYEVNPDNVNALISEQKLREMSETNIPVVASYILFGTDYNIVQYENEEIKTLISDELTTFAKENGIKVQERVIDDLYLAVCNTVTVNAAVIAQSYIDKVTAMAPSAIGYLKILNFWYIGVILAVICAIGIILINHNKIKSELYSLFTSIWLGSAVFFIPLLMLVIYNFPMRLGLEYSPMKLFFNGIFYGTQSVCLWVGAVAFTASCIGVAVSIFFNVRRKKHVQNSKEEET